MSRYNGFRRRLPLLLALTALAGAPFVWAGDGSPAVRVAGATITDNDTLTITRTHEVDRFHVSFVREGRIYGMEDHFLYSSSDSGQSFRLLGRLPRRDARFTTRIKDAVARAPLTRRLRRNPGPWSMVVLSSGTVLVFYDQVYRLAAGEHVFTPVFSLRDSIHGPFGQGVAVDQDDRVYFGEYAVHSSRPPRRVVRGVDDGRQWSVVHTFPQGAISHVHAIRYDSWRDRLWIATGDASHESALLFTDDEFATLDTLGHGSQDWRIVSFIVTDTHLYWGSDNDQTAAAIFSWSFADAALTRVRETGTPSYYATRLADSTLVVTTTYEPQSRYTRENSPEATTDLWISRDGRTWRRSLRLPYRERRMGDYLERARIQLPGGDYTAPVLLFSPFGTARGHFTTERWTVNWKN
jgi:hypothetical protein